MRYANKKLVKFEHLSFRPFYPRRWQRGNLFRTPIRKRFYTTYQYPLKLKKKIEIPLDTIWTLILRHRTVRSHFCVRNLRCHIFHVAKSWPQFIKYFRRYQKYLIMRCVPYFILYAYIYYFKFLPLIKWVYNNTWIRHRRGRRKILRFIIKPIFSTLKKLRKKPRLKKRKLYYKKRNKFLFF